MRKAFLFVLIYLIVCGTAFGGFFEKKEIQQIKAAKFFDYPSATIGKAFEGCFSDPKWEFYETRKGQRIVEFTGKIIPETRRDAAELIYDDVVNNIHVKNQILSGAIAGVGEDKVKQIYQSMQGQSEREKEIALILAGLHDFWTVGEVVTVRFALLDNGNFQIQDFSGPSLDVYNQDEFLQVIYY